MGGVWSKRGRRGISGAVFWRGCRKGRGGTRGRGCWWIDGGGDEGRRARKGRLLARRDLGVYLGRGLGVSRGGWVGAVLLPSGGVMVLLLLAVGRCLPLKRERLAVNIRGGRCRSGCRVAESRKGRAVGGLCRGGA